MKQKTIIRFASAVLAISMLCLVLTGCKDSKEANSDEVNSHNKYTHRVVLVSDMHYTTEETASELEVLHPGANASAAAGSTFGYTQKEKTEAILNDINNFTKKYPIDAVMVLGDISLDDCGFRNLPESYLKNFKTEILDKMDYPWYAIAGNHDSYSADEWKSIMGTDRAFSVKVGDAAFIMLDTFGDDLATDGSGSPYVGVDTEWLERELEKYPTETIFLCSHYYKPTAADYKFLKILKNNPRIVCMFRGHTHQNAVLADENMGYKYLVDIGGYAYNGDDSAGILDFGQFDDDWAWGYQVLEWNETEARIYHVKTPRTYTGTNGIFNFPGGIEDDIVIPIKKTISNKL